MVVTGCNDRRDRSERNVDKVRVQREPLPGIGERFRLVTSSGVPVTVVSRRGARHLVLHNVEAGAPVEVVLTTAEAAAVAALLLGVQVELVLTSP